MVSKGFEDFCVYQDRQRTRESCMSEEEKAMEQRAKEEEKAMIKKDAEKELEKHQREEIIYMKNVLKSIETIHDPLGYATKASKLIGRYSDDHNTLYAKLLCIRKYLSDEFLMELSRKVGKIISVSNSPNSVWNMIQYFDYLQFIDQKKIDVRSIFGYYLQTNSVGRMYRVFQEAGNTLESYKKFLSSPDFSYIHDEYHQFNALVGIAKKHSDNVIPDDEDEEHVQFFINHLIALSKTKK